MCGRYTFTQTPNPDQIVLPVGMSPEEVKPRYNVAPSQRVPVRASEDPEHFQYMRWGLIPFWAKDKRIGYKMINARMETVLTKPSFRTPIRKRRVLVWADGFYEWKKTGGKKQPYRITLKDGKPFYFAGIADHWRSPDGEEIDSFSVLTTEPNELMADIHDRMPVIFTEQNAMEWLDMQQETEELVHRYLRPYSADQMKAYPVSPAVGNVRNEGLELIKPYGNEYGGLFA